MEIKEVISYDAGTKMYCYYIFDESDKLLHIVNGQDCGPILKMNKIKREMEQVTDYKTTGISEEFASVPLTIDTQLQEKGIVGKEFLRWLERNPWWKTTNKRLI